MASKIGAYRYVECSARTGEGVTDVFHTAAKLALKNKGGMKHMANTSKTL